MVVDQGRWANVCRFDPAARAITLLFDGAALGLHDLDGLDVDGDGGITFSTETDAFVRGVHVRQENAYSASPDGQLTLRFNGGNLGLLTLDDFALGPGEGDGEAARDGADAAPHDGVVDTQ